MKIIICSTFVLMVSILSSQAFGAAATASAHARVLASVDLVTQQDPSKNQKEIQTKSYFEKTESFEKGQRIVEVIL